PFQPHHGADERIDEHQQRELPPVPRQPQLRRGRCSRHAPTSPRLNSSTASEPAGFGVTTATASTNASRSRESTLLKRFSKPTVLEGLPLRPAPHADPPKWAG